LGPRVLEDPLLGNALSYADHVSPPVGPGQRVVAGGRGWGGEEEHLEHAFFLGVEVVDRDRVGTGVEGLRGPLPEVEGDPDRSVGAGSGLRDGAVGPAGAARAVTSRSHLEPRERVGRVHRLLGSDPGLGVGLLDGIHEVLVGLLTDDAPTHPEVVSVRGDADGLASDPGEGPAADVLADDAGDLVVEQGRATPTTRGFTLGVVLLDYAPGPGVPGTGTGGVNWQAAALRPWDGGTG
jgi:hypothetical protein